MARLFTLDPVGVADTEVLARLRDCEALVSQLTVEQSRYLRELRGRRLAVQAGEHPHPDGVCASACCDDDGWVALEVGQQLGLSERQVASRIDAALRLDRYPAVAGAMQAGEVQAWTATRLLEHLDTLAHYVTEDRLAAVEAATVAWLLERTRTLTELNRRMRRLILAARSAAQTDSEPGSDADPGPDDRPDGGPINAQRRVSIAPASTPGLAELVALLPEADALAIRATLYALAHDPTDPDDPRSAEQRRADLLVTLVTGHPAGCGHPADAQGALRDPVELRVRLDVTVPADSLSSPGADRGTSPAWVPGYGDVPASTARALVQATASTGGCSGRPLVYDPATGHLLGFGATPVRIAWLSDVPPSGGYQHSATLRTAVQLRDGTCRAPGCTRRAARCDCDHVVPYPRGQTSLANTCSLCRRHHRLKTHAPGWTVSTGDAETGGAETGGLLTWTTPAGTRLTTYLHDYRPPDVTAPPPDDPPDDTPDDPPF